MGCGEGIPYDPIEAFGDKVIYHAPRPDGIKGENWKDKSVEV